MVQEKDFDAIALSITSSLKAKAIALYYKKQQERNEKSPVPKKIRELKSLLLKAGFMCESSKGSHTKWSHILLPDKIILSGKDGSDAKPYQEKDVTSVLKQLAKIQKKNEP